MLCRLQKCSESGGLEKSVFQYSNRSIAYEFDIYCALWARQQIRAITSTEPNKYQMCVTKRIDPDSNYPEGPVFFPNKCCYILNSMSCFYLWSWISLVWAERRTDITFLIEQRSIMIVLYRNNYIYQLRFNIWHIKWNRMENEQSNCQEFNEFLEAVKIFKAKNYVFKKIEFSGHVDIKNLVLNFKFKKTETEIKPWVRNSFLQFDFIVISLKRRK